MMEYIPIHMYHTIYYYVVFFVVLLTVVNTSFNRSGDTFSLVYNRVALIGMLFFLMLYIGLRPINGVFTDMMVYNSKFVRYQEGMGLDEVKDIGFYGFMKWCARVMSSPTFFFICAALYVYPLYRAFKRWFPHYAFLALLFYAASFSFFAYGTNGIRSGIASSLFILAAAYTDRRWFAVALLLIAFSFHASMFLPIAAFILAYFYRETRWYIVIWLMCIPLSLVAGGFWEGLFGGVDTSDERLQAYMESDKAVSGVFRWDFLLYSAVAVWAGYYFTKVKGFTDELYIRLFNTYLMTNAFWILVIRANYSNRFAYLSWFLLPIIIFYPLLKQTMMERQYARVGLILFVYFMFTYVMNVLLV